MYDLIKAFIENMPAIIAAATAAIGGYITIRMQTSKQLVERERAMRAKYHMCSKVLRDMIDRLAIAGQLNDYRDLLDKLDELDDMDF